MESFVCYSDEFNESLHFDHVTMTLTVYSGGEEVLFHWYVTEEDYKKAVTGAKSLNWKVE